MNRDFMLDYYQDHFEDYDDLFDEDEMLSSLREEQNALIDECQRQFSKEHWTMLMDVFDAMIRTSSRLRELSYLQGAEDREKMLQ